MANKMADKKKNASQSKMVASAPIAQSSVKEKDQSRNVKTMTRERENKSGRRESKRPSERQLRFRNNRIVRFVRESYYELRYKVTWPTFIEARNMTFIVIGLSVAVGALLAIVDVGLTQLFLRITGR